MLGKLITYVTAQCHYFSSNMFFLRLMAPFFASRSTLSCLKRTMFAKNEYDQKMSQLQTADQPTVP